MEAKQDKERNEEEAREKERQEKDKEKEAQERERQEKERKEKQEEREKAEKAEVEKHCLKEEFEAAAASFVEMHIQQTKIKYKDSHAPRRIAALPQYGALIEGLDCEEALNLVQSPAPAPKG